MYRKYHARLVLDVANYCHFIDNSHMSKQITWGAIGVIVAVLCIAVVSPAAQAVTSQSTNFKLDEGTIGGSGSVQGSSANYQSTDSAGDLSIGNTSSTNFQVETGSTTTGDPSLSFAIGNGAVGFGAFTAAGATTTTTTFSVLNYTSYGYVVQIAGNAPTNGSNTIDPMAVTGSSSPGVEQFGMNLVANTAPVSIGANPNNGSFGFGAASANYGTSNQYRYVSGETIALAPKSSGVTTYTISYLVNVAALTQGGIYTSDQTIIVTGTY
jgi:hypothetical protein